MESPASLWEVCGVLEFDKSVCGSVHTLGVYLDLNYLRKPRLSSTLKKLRSLLLILTTTFAPLSDLSIELKDETGCVLDGFRDLLDGIVYGNLRWFSSVTLPHDLLAAFLVAQTRLNGITILRCSGKANSICPINNMKTKLLQRVRCAATCAPVLLTGSTPWRLALLDEGASPIPAFSSLTSRFGASFAQLLSLEIFFSCEETAILRTIADACPRLTRLVLREAIRSQEVRHGHVFIFMEFCSSYTIIRILLALAPLRGMNIICG